ncbi:MAG: hypothetical protein HDQ88_09115, partial [Clostridia bacterium]|nr:hypothetical protein [Clostridia bacterium]
MAQFSDNKFCLHDTEVSAIECLNNKINLIFNDGIYVLNDKGKEAEKTLKCAMSLEIREFNPDTAWEHITVYKFKGKKFKEISFNNFCELVKENGFKVYL